MLINWSALIDRTLFAIPCLLSDTVESIIVSTHAFATGLNVLKIFDTTPVSSLSCVIYSATASIHFFFTAFCNSSTFAIPKRLTRTKMWLSFRALLNVWLMKNVFPQPHSPSKNSAPVGFSSSQYRVISSHNAVFLHATTIIHLLTLAF